jgi:uncharacterized protein (DUF3820 family)
MWRLISNNGLQTGIDLRTGRDLENISRKVTKKDRQQAEAGELIITFGKYKDKTISEVDNGYLKWAAKNFNEGRWGTIFNEEIERRTINV